MNVGSVGSSSYLYEMNKMYSQTQGSAGTGGMEPPSLTKDELTKMADRMKSSGDSAAKVFSLAVENFDSADTNQDGKVSFDEMQSFAKANGLTLSQPKPRESAGVNGSQPPALSKDELSKMVEKIGSTSDSGASLFSLALKQFDSVDTNQDGKISFDEMQTFAKANNLSMPSPGANGGKPPEEMLSTTNGSDNSSDDEEMEALLETLQQNSVQAYSAYAESDGSRAILGSGVLA